MTFQITPLAAKVNNLNGKNIIQKQHAIQTIDLSQITPGIYLIKVETENKTFSRKIIIYE